MLAIHPNARSTSVVRAEITRSSEGSSVAEFSTIRLWLLKLGARIRETAARVRLAFVAACPEADLLRHIATVLVPAPA